jgi:glycosyltransferase involved in cell wall biosynthesis/2-polyprenyl-3-methyl-5-hydroxy-6-metoxy-1,4-benzoquinol methylase
LIAERGIAEDATDGHNAIRSRGSRATREGLLGAMTAVAEKQRVLVFVVAYNAATTIREVLARIPASLSEDYRLEILVIDDASQDGTFELGEAIKTSNALPFPLTVLRNPANQGYGGNQKIGYHYALQNGFDFVALVHGDGQYAPEFLPQLLRPLRDGEADAVFGSRMLEPGAARRGGMPLYKFIGNRLLTWLENRLLRTHLSEFHSGFRIYSTAALEKIPFDLNTNDFHFDTEIIIQLLRARLRIRELPIPTHYGNEISRVSGVTYAWNVIKASSVARAQELGLFYDRRFDCEPTPPGGTIYALKDDFDSSHTAALARIKQGARVLDLGCGSGEVGALLRRRSGCTVTGVGRDAAAAEKLDAFVPHDLGTGPPDVIYAELDYVLLLDIIEHLPSPERFVDQLRAKLKFCPHVTIIASSANVGFFVTRFMLLFGQFNYGKRGILDLTHTRLFTFASLRRLFEQGGFQVIERRGVPAPFPLALGPGRTARCLVAANRLLIGLSRSLFAYQIFMVVRPRRSLELLLQTAQRQSAVGVDATAHPNGPSAQPPISARAHPGPSPKRATHCVDEGIRGDAPALARATKHAQVPMIPKPGPDRP